MDENASTYLRDGRPAFRFFGMSAFDARRGAMPFDFLHSSLREFLGPCVEIFFSGCVEGAIPVSTSMAFTTKT